MVAWSTRLTWEDMKDFRDYWRSDYRSSDKHKRFKSLLQLSVLIYCQAIWLQVIQYFPKFPQLDMVRKAKRCWWSDRLRDKVFLKIDRSLRGIVFLNIACLNTNCLNRIRGRDLHQPCERI